MNNVKRFVLIRGRQNYPAVPWVQAPEVAGSQQTDGDAGSMGVKALANLGVQRFVKGC